MKFFEISENGEDLPNDPLELDRDDEDAGGCCKQWPWGFRIGHAEARSIPLEKTLDVDPVEAALSLAS